MHIPRNTLFALLLVVGLAGGYWLGSSPQSPVNPNPPRPIARALGYALRCAARFGLWVAVAGERAPVQEDRQQLVRAPRVDADGHRVIDHAEGW